MSIVAANNTEGVALNRKEKYAIDKFGERHGYDKLILATGTRAHVPNDAPVKLPGVFTMRYVFPDSDPLPLSPVLLALEPAGVVTEHVEGFGRDYAETLRHWARRLDERRADAVRIAGAERVRVWRLYLRGARKNFESEFISIYQVKCRLRASPTPGRLSPRSPAHGV